MLYEKEILEYLNIPSIPQKKWDGKPFKNACGIVHLKGKNTAFAVFGFSDSSNAPYIKKVFGEEPIINIGEIYPIPDYMDMQGIENWDVPDESKDAAQNLANEAIEMEKSQQNEEDEFLSNEWFFDEIHNIDEARAWVANYRKKKRMRGKPIKDEESLKNFLYVIYKNKKRGI